MNTDINLGSIIIGFVKNEMIVSLYNHSDSTYLTKHDAKLLISQLKKVIKDLK